MSNHLADIAAAHLEGIDLSYRAPDLPYDIRERLPEPILDRHPDWLDLYWRAWSIAYDQVSEPTPGSGLVPFCDAAFSKNLFQWDTCFMMQFLRYAHEPFEGYGSLDNFYLKQHDDGFICREIDSVSGDDFWPRSHLSSVNPPLFADAEWALYCVTADVERLAAVFEPLCRYDAWLNENRRVTDGIGFWTTALGSGMDNSPRAHAMGGQDVHEPYGYTWMCMTAQQALAAHRLSCIAQVLGETNRARQFSAQFERLRRYVVEQFWDDDSGCYVDVMPNGALSRVLTPAMCWPLLLDGHPEARGRRVVSALLDESKFWRSHAPSSLSVDHPLYDETGDYWRGSVWPPMVYLAARAMRACGERNSARRLAQRHLENLSAVFGQTGTFWENYRAESADPGVIARPEFVGWTGCGPIAMLLEDIIGIEVSAPDRLVTWNLDTTQRSGVRRLPVGKDQVDLEFDPECGQLSVGASGAIDVEIIQGSDRQRFIGVKGRRDISLAQR